MNKMSSERLFSSDNPLLKNAPILAILGGVIFFVVAHPFVFDAVDSVIESVTGSKTQRDLLVFIHAIVFGGLFFGCLYLGKKLDILN